MCLNNRIITSWYTVPLIKIQLFAARFFQYLTECLSYIAIQSFTHMDECNAIFKIKYAGRETRVFTRSIHKQCHVGWREAKKVIVGSYYDSFPKCSVSLITRTHIQETFYSEFKRCKLLLWRIRYFKQNFAVTSFPAMTENIFHSLGSKYFHVHFPFHFHVHFPFQGQFIQWVENVSGGRKS